MLRKLLLDIMIMAHNEPWSIGHDVVSCGTKYLGILSALYGLEFKRVCDSYGSTSSVLSSGTSFIFSPSVSEEGDLLHVVSTTCLVNHLDTADSST